MNKQCDCEGQKCSRCCNCNECMEIRAADEADLSKDKLISDLTTRVAVLEAALKESRNLAAQAATFEVDAATSTEPGSDVFGSAGIAKKSLTKRARDAWKQYDSLVDSTLAGSTSALSDYGREVAADVETEIRKQLWLAHGHASIIYGDDGEMQCSACMLDFKRDPWEKIVSTLNRRVAVATAKMIAEKVLQNGGGPAIVGVFDQVMLIAAALANGTAEVPR